MEEIGPVDYAIIAFPGNQFTGDIAPALADLVDAGTIRIIDITFVGKDENGDVVAAELTELDPQVRAGLENMCRSTNARSFGPSLSRKKMLKIEKEMPKASDVRP